MLGLRERGDTIIEVLLALVIISVVLGGAFISSGQSLTNDRRSQERGEAMKYVEAQLEQIKAHAATAVAQASPFCFNTDNSGTTLSPGPSIPDPSLDNDPFGSYAAGCKAGTIPGGYHISIVKSTADTIFTVRARWDNASGKGRDEVKIFYKVTP